MTGMYSRTQVFGAALGAAALLTLSNCTTSTVQPANLAPSKINECARLADPNCTFAGTPITLSDTPSLRVGSSEYFATLQTLGFTDTSGQIWQAPSRTLTDGASIPAIFTPLVGNPKDPEFINAAIMHDAYCGVGNEDGPNFQTRTWEEVHRMFYEALISSGVGETRAKIMFAAVYLGGPRWRDPDRDLSGVERDRLIREMEWCIRWINRTNPSGDRIVAWMREREAVLKSDNHSAPDWDALFAEAEAV